MVIQAEAEEEAEREPARRKDVVREAGPAEHSPDAEAPNRIPVARPAPPTFVTTELAVPSS